MKMERLLAVILAVAMIAVVIPFTHEVSAKSAYQYDEDGNEYYTTQKAVYVSDNDGNNVLDHYDEVRHYTNRKMDQNGDFYYTTQKAVYVSDNDGNNVLDHYEEVKHYTSSSIAQKIYISDNDGNNIPDPNQVLDYEIIDVPVYTSDNDGNNVISGYRQVKRWFYRHVDESTENSHDDNDTEDSDNEDTEATIASASVINNNELHLNGTSVASTIAGIVHTDGEEFVVSTPANVISETTGISDAQSLLMTVYQSTDKQSPAAASVLNTYIKNVDLQVNAFTPNMYTINFYGKQNGVYKILSVDGKTFRIVATIPQPSIIKGVNAHAMAVYVLSGGRIGSTPDLDQSTETVTIDVPVNTATYKVFWY